MDRRNVDNLRLHFRFLETVGEHTLVEVTSIINIRAVDVSALIITSKVDTVIVKECPGRHTITLTGLNE